MSEKGVDEKINRLSMMEQNAQYLGSQRQNLQNQMLELDSALEEIETSSDSYKIIGNIMVKHEKKNLQKELKEKKSLIETKISSLTKQEDAVKEKATKLREEVMQGLNKGGKSGSDK